MTESLHEIEKTLGNLWTKRVERERFVSSLKTKKQKRSTAGGSASAELIAEIDKDGVLRYADLLSSQYQESLRSIFPYSAKVLGVMWPKIVEDFLAHHPPTSYKLTAIGEKFPEFLSKAGRRYLRNCQFVEELADYEWLDLKLFESEEEIHPVAHEQIIADSQLTLRPVINPVLRVRHFNFPIAEIVEILSEEESFSADDNFEAAESWVVVLRDPDDHRCRLIAVAPLGAMLIEFVQRQSPSYNELLTKAIGGVGVADGTDVIADVSAADVGQNFVENEFLLLIERLQELRVFIGSV